METQHLYEIIKILLEYIKQNEKEEAIFSILDYMLNESNIDLYKLQQIADDEEDTIISKCILKFIKANDLEDDKEDEDMIW